MGLKNAALLAGAVMAACSAALSQAYGQVDNGYEVTVNPVAMGGGVLLYPGGQYARVVPHLRQPGDTGKPIILHMPSRHPRTVHAAAAEPAPAPRPRKVARAPVAAPAPSAPLAEGPPPSNSVAGLFDNMPAPAPAPAPRQTKVARAEPAPEQTAITGLSKRSMILFAPAAPDPSKDSLSAIRFLAGDLSAAMNGSAAARIQLQAFGGAKGDKGSDARRLSLKRALAIRQVLIDDGVSPDRIGVSAMGGADEGPPDRVDVYLKS